MTEEQNITQAVNTPVDTVNTPANTPAQAPAETAQDTNWRQFREQREAERKARAEAEKRAKEKEQEAEALKAALESVLNKAQPTQQHHEDTEEDIIQRKIDQAIAANRKKLEEEYRAREQAQYPERLNTTFKDFNQVCSKENCDYLEYHYPEVAAAYAYMPEGYDKWANIYQAIKKLVPNTDAKRDAKKIEQNLSKPQSMSALPVGQTGDMAPIMPDDKKYAANWARMQKIMKGQ